jgi:hypothetical protein
MKCCLLLALSAPGLNEMLSAPGKNKMLLALSAPGLNEMLSAPG